MSGELVAALAGAIVGGVVGAGATLAATIAQEWWRDRGRGADMRTALITALDRNLAIMAEIPGALGTGEDAVVPQTVDLALLDATAEAKYGLLDVAACAAVDRARSRLAAVRRGMEHRAGAWQLTTLGIQVSSGPEEMDAKREWSNVLLNALAQDVTKKLIPPARAACEEALRVLRGQDAAAGGSA